MESNARRVSFLCLCAAPFLLFGLAAPRYLREVGAHHAVGAVAFVAVVLAAWVLGLRALRGGGEDARRQAVAGGLLCAPFAVIGLLWVGIGPPAYATPPENYMRYLVLLASSISITSGFFLAREALVVAGERLHSSFGFVASLLGGAAYLIWNCFAVGLWLVRVRNGQSSALAPLGDPLDVMLFVACVLTYLATASFALAFGRVRWLGRSGSRAYAVLALAAAALLMTRGISFPDLAGPAPWYLRPAFVVGIPAIPWILPFLLGVILLRRAGDPG